MDAYRISTIPLFRYAIHPVSEAFIRSGVAELRDPEGRAVQQVYYAFDASSEVKGYHYLLEKHLVSERFVGIVDRIDSCEFENELSVSYCLAHMRRWAEAVVIASAVVESLLREAVFKAAASEKLAKVLWSAYRTRGEDLFKEILPALGFAHLPSDAPSLWAAYQIARKNRGAIAHGQRTYAFERNLEAQTKTDLSAFARTARWISLQIGRPWALDVPDAGHDGQLMPEFP